MATDTYTRQEAAKLQAIEQYEAYVAELETLAAIQKRKHKLAAERVDTAIAQMRRLINLDVTNVLPGMEESRLPPVPIHATWQDLPTSVVISDKEICQKLAEYNIETVGSLVIYLRSDSSLQDLSLSEDEEHEVLHDVQLYWNTEHKAQDDL